MSSRSAGEAGLGAWFEAWHSGLAPCRIAWVRRAFLGLVAIDAGHAVLTRHVSHGAGGFDVAHFRVLDGLPLPTPALHLGALFVVALVGGVMALGRPARLGVATVGCAYTYSWAMSRQDSFQHHYFVSLALFCLALVADDEVPPVWPVKLLSATTAIMYGFAAVAKLEPAWLSGATLELLWASSPSLGGTLPRWASRGLSVGAIVLEVFVAVAYLRVVVAPDRPAPGGQRWGVVGWLAAVVLHGSIAVLGLHIGWFSAYMVLLPTLLLAPLGLLQRVLPGERSREAFPRGAPRDPKLNALLVVVGAVALLVTGKLIELDVPGSVGSAALVGGGCSGVAVVLAARGASARLADLNVGWWLSLGLWWLAIAAFPVEANPFNLGSWLG